MNFKYFILIVFCIQLNSSYKLNVPKVLLPFHSSNVINFTLELINEDDDIKHQQQNSCFLWSSSRPEIVSIEPIYENQQEKCSTKAIVSSISKYPQRLTSIIIAKEISTDKVIRCDVIVDKLTKISIKHTTTQLYLEDSPECFVSEAFDLEGNSFTTIEGLPFEWLVVNKFNTNEYDVLNILKFIDSEYIVSDVIRNLELTGLYGNKILIEGVKTGTANVQAKLLDPFYKNMSTELVRLLVVANILLEPSYPIYLLTGSSIKYRVVLIKQASSDEIVLPSTQYYFESNNLTCAQLNPIDSSILLASLAPCNTQIILIDRNMKQFAEQYIPPTSEVTVVEAGYIKFQLKNYPITQFLTSTWVLEIDKVYEIEIYAYTADHKQIYASDSINYNTIFDLTYFNIIKSTSNGSYFCIFAKKQGLTQGKSSLNGVFDANNNLKSFEKSIIGKQDIELLNPIKINPELLIFAWKFNANQPLNYEYQLQATGGSGLYQWQSKNIQILTVSNTGYLKLNNRFISNNQYQQHTSIEAFIHVHDQKNSFINAASRVLLLEPVQLDIMKCPIETNINKTINIRIQMHAIHNEKKLPITDCSKLNFKIWLQNENIFKFLKVDSKLDHESINDDSCAVISFLALSEGSTLVRVSYEVNSDIILESEQTIYSYSSLKTNKNFYLLNHLSSYLVRVSGGLYLTQPTNGESQKLVESLSVENGGLIDIVKIYDSKLKRNNYEVRCKEVSGEAKINLQISNEHDENSNKCPLKFEHEFKIKCAKPYKFELSQLLLNKSKLAYMRECPFKPLTTPSNGNIVIQHCRLPLNVEIKVKDENNNEFDNFTSKNDTIEWHIDNANLLGSSRSGQKLKYIEVDNKLVYYTAFKTQNLMGEVNIEGKFKELNAKLFVKLIDNLKILQNGLQLPANSLMTIINHPTNVLNLQIAQGSGYYLASLQPSLQEVTDSNKVIDFSLNENNLIVKPINIGNAVLNIYDYCILQSEINEANSLLISDVSNEYKLQFQVTDINTIQVEIVDNKIELNKYLILYVQINDANGNRLKKSLFSLMNLKYKLSNNNNAILKLITPEIVNSNDEFYLTMIKSTTNEQLNYEKIVKLSFNDDYSALYVLHAQKNDGLISIQFEANLNNGPLIQSKQIDIAVYSPLKVNPKKMDLIIGSNYQLKFNGGPDLNENIILKYELTNEHLFDQRQKPVLHVHQNGTINALHNGNVTINVKIIGLCNDNNINNYKLCELIKLSKKQDSNINEIIYTYDIVQINIVQLKSIHIETPLKYIKIGNSVPIFLIANKHSDLIYLKPTSFGTSSFLNYKWSLNNNNFAQLESNLAESGINFGLNTFSLVFNAKNVGTVRIAVQINALKNDIINGGNNQLTDHIDITIIDSAKFIKLNNNFNSLILTPGSQLQLRTNRDNLAKKITYEIYNSKLMNEEYLATQETLKQHQNQVPCSNDRLNVDANGILKIDKNINLRQYKHQTCIAVALIRIEEDFKKQQYLYYLIEVKPIRYFMLKSKTNIQILNESYLNSLPLDVDFNLQLHFYDDFGDQFSIQDSSYPKFDYDLSRSDLIELNEDEEKGRFKLKSTDIGNTLVSIKNTNQKLDISDYFLHLPINKLNIFKNNELTVTQMDIINLNHDFILKYQLNVNESAEIIEQLNENYYYWSLKDFKSENSINFVNEEQTLAICLLNGNYEIELKPKKQNIKLTFMPLKINIQEVANIDVFINKDKSFIFTESLSIKTVFNKNELNHLKYVQKEADPNLAENYVNKFINEHNVNLNCLFKFNFAKSHSQTQKMIEIENHLARYLSFKPIFQQNSWTCQLNTNKYTELNQIYEHLVSLYKLPVSAQQEQSFVSEIIELPTHVTLWSNIQTSKHLIESPKLKVDFYFKFSLNFNEINFNINNLFLSSSDKLSGSKQLSKLRIDNNFNTKLFIYTPEYLTKQIGIRLSHSNLFKIKQLGYSKQELKLNFILELIEFNIETLVQSNLDGIFIEITCDLTKQQQKIPIYIHFDKCFNLIQDKHGLLHITSNIQTSSFSSDQSQKYSGGFLSSLFDISSGQLINYLAIVSLILIVTLFLLKYKIPNNNQPGPMQAHRILNGSFVGGSPARQQHPPELRYRGNQRSPFNYSGSTSHSSASRYSPQSNDIRLFSVDTDGQPNDSIRYYHSFSNYNDDN